MQIKTQTDVQPTSTRSELSDELVHPEISIAEYMLAKAKIKWKNE